MSAGGSRKFFDWRFFISLMAMMAVAFIIYGSFTGQRDSAHKSDQIQELLTQNALDSAQSARATVQFNLNQQRLLADQHELLAYTAALANRQDAILEYLSRHGVKIPQHLLKPIVPPTLAPVEQPPAVSSPKGPPPSAPKPPTPTSAPAPTPAPQTGVSPSPQHPSPHPGASPSPAPAPTSPLSPIWSLLPTPLPLSIP